ncbi:substrate-binding domain-containing protein [Metasolibacillus meyeri]|uniref:Substrate-binding domain-containing protein n=1 Tax=Metasolibacillus meyeri TaxID=1071052 RepID=A0AAW9NY74_9BACL|nr:substrate-binding domain-containing protein [Metasolibacillus meyeri]MEC1180341.1 substrate-binding domain-containing protein [Metasolibacillus meyeri]
MMEKIGSIVLLTISILFFGTPLVFLSMLFWHQSYVWLLAVAIVVIYILFILKILQFFKTTRRKQVTAFIMVGIIIVPVVLAGQTYYESKLATVDSEINIWAYHPFTEDNQVVQLDEQSTLTLHGTMPKMDGATALYPLYTAFVEATYPENPDYFKRTVMVNKTPDAYQNVMNHKVDVIFAAGPSERQLKLAQQKNIELNMTPIGKEAFVFFVHKNNPIDNLTLEQVRGIYSGEITNWSQVGGANEKIRAFQRPEDSGSQTALQRLMEDTPIMTAEKRDVVTGMGGIIEEVAQYKNYKNALGYTFRYYSTEMVRNDQIKLLSIEGIAPTKENIRNNTYPITSEFYAITAGTSNDNTEKLIEWILSPQGQALVEKVGYVPVDEANK